MTAAGRFFLVGTVAWENKGRPRSVGTDCHPPHLGDGRLDGHGVYPGHGGVPPLAGHCGETTRAGVSVGVASHTCLEPGPHVPAPPLPRASACPAAEGSGPGLPGRPAELPSHPGRPALLPSVLGTRERVPRSPDL